MTIVSRRDVQEIEQLAGAIATNFALLKADLDYDEAAGDPVRAALVEAVRRVTNDRRLRSAKWLAWLDAARSALDDGTDRPEVSRR